jgi:hypothetical protein
MATFAPDSGSWEVDGGALSVAAASLGLDAAAVWYHDAYLPVYYEVEARVSLVKPTAGWKANAYVVFDYWGPDDFKFAGLDDAENKLVMGYKDAAGWHTVAQSPIPGGVKYDRWYDLLVAVNGTNVTVLLNGSDYFTYTFAPRVIDDVSYGLNKGLLGFGSDNSRGKFDNIQLQILPPTLTLDRTEDFSDAVDDVTWTTTGSWSVVSAEYLGTVTGGDSASARAGLGKTLAYDAFLEFEALVDSSDPAGLVFDYYNDEDFKYLAIDVATDTVTLGHRTPAGWTTDQTAGLLLDPAIAHHVKITIKGASVTVTVDGQTLFTYGYNSPLVDGEFGLLTTGSSTFDDVRVKTNDPGFDEYDPDGSLISIGDAFATEGDSGTTEVTLTVELDVASTDRITVDWVTGPGSALGDVDFVVSSGTVVFEPGELSKTITVEVIGDAEYEGDETFTVSLSNATGGATIDDGLGVVTIEDDDAAPALPTLSIGDATVAEGDSGTTTVDLTITRNGDLSGASTVDWATQDGSASAGTDYLAASGTASFAAGENTVVVSITVYGDTDVEGDEDFTVFLSNATWATISDGTGLVTITNDDAAPTDPTLDFDDVSTPEGDKKFFLTVSVSLSAPAASTVTVDYATGGGTATAGIDYQASSGTLTFAPGETVATFTVRILSDKTPEDDETIGIILSNVTGPATLLDGTGTVTILDDDGALRASAAGAEPVADAALDIDAVEPLLAVATTMWAAIGVETSALGDLAIEIVDLPGTMLADTSGTTIYLDVSAAGWGWFVDSTPWENSEFERGRHGALSSSDGTLAAQRIDLLTVLLHEIGHLLGFEHSHRPGSVMAAILDPGVRRLLPVHRPAGLQIR